MSKKLVFCLALLTIGVWVVDCVTPFYGTARIEPGGHLDVGIATDVVRPLKYGDFPNFPRAELGIRHGFKESFQINGRIGIVYMGGDELPVFPVAGLGIQVAAPQGVVTPAFGVEVSFPPTFTPTFLLGIGGNETATLGVRLHIFPDWVRGGLICMPDAFITGHLGSRLSIFAGVGFFIDAPVVTLGVGYKIK